MNTKIIAILMAGIVAMAMVVPMAMGGSQVTQEVTVTTATTLDINAQDGLAAISTIAFNGASGSTDSAPTNNVDTGSPQNLAANTPVAVIANTGSVTLKVFLTASGVNFQTLVHEELATVAATASSPLAKALTWDTAVDTGATIAGSATQKLFLEAKLEGSGTAIDGKLTVEGEA